MKQWEQDIKSEIEYTGRWLHCSVYTGIGGYALLYLEASRLLNNNDYLEQAFFMAEKCCMHLDGQVLTFLIGDGGPLAIAAVCAHLLKQPEKEHHFIHRLERFYHSYEDLLDPKSQLPDELLYGRAGCLYALLFIKQVIKRRVDEHLIAGIAKAIVESGKKLAKSLQSQGRKTPPLMFEWHKKKYLGAAHGLAGILYLLLKVKEHLGVHLVENEIRQTIDYLLDLSFPSGNYPSSLENDEDRLVQWCHGSPGFIHCLVEASKVYDSERYLAAAKRCAEVSWERGVLTKGFSICHGIAGNAMGILHLYQHTKDPLYLHRAYKMAEIITDAAPHEFRTPDRPLSMFEGTAGVILFLLSLSQPDKALFPGYQLMDELC